MKILIAYSSGHGNTKEVAESLHKEFINESLISDIDCIPSTEGYDYIFVGFWVDKGHPDEKASVFLNSLHEKKVGLFATLGAYPYSIHAHRALVRAAELLDDTNSVEGAFICQGKLSEESLEKIAALPPTDPRYPTPKTDLRREIGSTHPDEDDFKEARKIFRYIVERDI